MKLPNSGLRIPQVLTDPLSWIRITSLQMCNFIWLFRVLWRILSVAF
jgi:hypothetical protein